MAKAILIALALLLAVPAVSRAAVAEVKAGSKESGLPNHFVSYSADPGEANHVSVVNEQHGSQIDDAGAQLRAGSGCDQLSPHAVFCHAKALFATLGDGDDSLDAPKGNVDGGPGNDVLRVGGDVYGGLGDDLLVGRAGNDRLDGGGGRDVLRGGAGNDDLRDGDFDFIFGDVGPDVIDGGKGSDSVTYSRRQGQIVVDLRRAGGQGGPGEGDTLRSVESVFSEGARDRDVVIGNGAANGIDVFGDHSIARGMGGDDYITAWSTRRDVLSGGPGNDILERGDDFPAGVPDALSCGPGHDVVYLRQEHAAQFVPSDCEWVKDGDDATMRYRLRGSLPRLNAVVARVSMGECITDEPDCSFVWALRQEVGHGAGSRGPLLAKRVQHVRRNRVAPLVALRLTRAGRALLARRGKVRARLGEWGIAGVVGGFVMPIRLCRTLTRSC
jgi:RTX calcium-binding nonapeptide repeat (4 copies)